MCILYGQSEEKMQKFVKAVLKKLLNGYSVIPVYNRCFYMYYSKKEMQYNNW